MFQIFFSNMWKCMENVLAAAQWAAGRWKVLVDTLEQKERNFMYSTAAHWAADGIYMVLEVYNCGPLGRNWNEKSIRQTALMQAAARYFSSTRWWCCFLHCLPSHVFPVQGRRLVPLTKVKVKRPLQPGHFNHFLQIHNRPILYIQAFFPCINDV